MGTRGAGRVPSLSRNRRDVFVIHGRDERAREAFFGLFRAIDLRPLEWEMLVKATGDSSPSLLTVVTTALDRAQAVVALLTPDDVVHLHPALHESNEPAVERLPALQSRPNVLIELGMALMRCQRRTIIVEVGSLRPVADLGGLNVIRFDGTETQISKLVQRLRTAGCLVDDSGTDWRNARRFAGLAALSRQAA